MTKVVRLPEQYESHSNHVIEQEEQEEQEQETVTNDDSDQQTTAGSYGTSRNPKAPTTPLEATRVLDSFALSLNENGEGENVKEGGRGGGEERINPKDNDDTVNDDEEEEEEDDDDEDDDEWEFAAANVNENENTLTKSNVSTLKLQQRLQEQLAATAAAHYSRRNPSYWGTTTTAPGGATVSAIQTWHAGTSLQPYPQPAANHTMNTSTLSDLFTPPLSAQSQQQPQQPPASSATLQSASAANATWTTWDNVVPPPPSSSFRHQHSATAEFWNYEDSSTSLGRSLSTQSILSKDLENDENDDDDNHGPHDARYLKSSFSSSRPVEPPLSLYNNDHHNQDMLQRQRRRRQVQDPRGSYGDEKDEDSDDDGDSVEEEEDDDDDDDGDDDDDDGAEDSGGEEEDDQSTTTSGSMNQTSKTIYPRGDALQPRLARHHHHHHHRRSGSSWSDGSIEKDRFYDLPQPVLYSAIGSLEDPSNSSFDWNRNRHRAIQEGGRQTRGLGGGGSGGGGPTPLPAITKSSSSQQQQQQQSQQSQPRPLMTNSASSQIQPPPPHMPALSQQLKSSRGGPKLPIPKHLEMPPGLLLVPLSTLMERQQQQQKNQKNTRQQQPLSEKPQQQQQQQQQQHTLAQQLPPSPAAPLQPPRQPQPNELQPQPPVPSHTVPNNQKCAAAAATNTMTAISTSTYSWTGITAVNGKSNDEDGKDVAPAGARAAANQTAAASEPVANGLGQEMPAPMLLLLPPTPTPTPLVSSSSSLPLLCATQTEGVNGESRKNASDKDSTTTTTTVLAPAKVPPPPQSPSQSNGHGHVHHNNEADQHPPPMIASSQEDDEDGLDVEREDGRQTQQVKYMRCNTSGSPCLNTGEMDRSQSNMDTTLQQPQSVQNDDQNSNNKPPIATKPMVSAMIHSSRTDQKHKKKKKKKKVQINDSQQLVHPPQNNAGDHEKSLLQPENGHYHPHHNESSHRSLVKKVSNGGHSKKRSHNHNTKQHTLDTKQQQQEQEEEEEQPRVVVELFRPSSDAYTPRINGRKKEIKYKPAEQRRPLLPDKMSSGLGTLSRPNFRDALRRVAMILHQHIVKIELRFETNQRRQREQERMERLRKRQQQQEQQEQQQQAKGQYINRTTSGQLNGSVSVSGLTRSSPGGSSSSKHSTSGHQGQKGRKGLVVGKSPPTHKLQQPTQTDTLFMSSMQEEFNEDHFITPTYQCKMVRVPMARGGLLYGLQRVRPTYEIPSENEIYEFAHRLFQTVQLSSECSIVCLIYVERLMEEGKVPLLASTWRPIVLTGLLLASKVWQDLSSWNIEFTHVYPQYSLDAIHRLEIKFLRILQWNLYITSSLYAKYYFALRSLVEKMDFRQRYNRMVLGVGGMHVDNTIQVQEAKQVQERSSLFKAEALLQLSRSM